MFEEVHLFTFVTGKRNGPKWLIGNVMVGRATRTGQDKADPCSLHQWPRCTALHFTMDPKCRTRHVVQRLP